MLPFKSCPYCTIWIDDWVELKIGLRAFMKSHFSREMRGVVLPIIVTGFLVPGASAAIQLPLSIMFSGANPPSSPLTPWVSATFEEEVGGTVLFTLSAPNLTGSENVSAFYFNFDNTLNVQNLNFQLVSGGAFTLPTIDQMQDSYMADGDGKYDIRLNLAVGGSVNQTFGQGDQLVYRLSYAGGIDSSDFQYLSVDAGGHGPFYAAAHVQNVPGGEGAWIAATTIDFLPVPEASTMLAGMCLLGVWVACCARKACPHASPDGA